MANDAERLRRSLERAAQRMKAIATELEDVDARRLTPETWLHVRARMGVLAADVADKVAEVDRVLGTTGARPRLLRYLRLRIREKVTKDELSGVAGIYEWARRIRELREDDGWMIRSSVTRPDLRPGEYVLVQDEPDVRLARRWALAKQFRGARTLGGPLPPKARVLEFLKAIFPEAAEKDELVHVAGSAKRVDEILDALRNEGWDVVEGHTDGDEHTTSWRLATLSPEQLSRRE